MAVQVSLCTAWLETPKDTFCHVVAQICLNSYFLTVVPQLPSEPMCIFNIFQDSFMNRGIYVFVKIGFTFSSIFSQYQERQSDSQ